MHSWRYVDILYLCFEPILRLTLISHRKIMRRWQKHWFKWVLLRVVSIMPNLVASWRKLSSVLAVWSPKLSFVLTFKVCKPTESVSWRSYILISMMLPGDTLDAQLAVDEKETTRIVLEIVGVAERNGLKLPREFGLVLKQVCFWE